MTRTRPEQSLFLAQSGEVDAVIQEAIMTPWWRDVIETNHFVPLPAEEAALQSIAKYYPGMVSTESKSLPAGFWPSLSQPLPVLDFSDFMVLVREDLPEDVAHLLTWCLVETRDQLEAQYRHLPPEKSPVSYPLVPSKMAKTTIPLHPGARKYYAEAGHL